MATNASHYTQSVRIPAKQRRDSRAFDIGTRMAGSAWFLLLAVFAAKSLWDARLHAEDFHTLLSIVARICLVLFYLAVWALLIVRRPVAGRARGLFPGVAAFMGTYLPIAIPLLGHATGSSTLLMLSSLFLVAGLIFMLITLFHLGRSFSIVPQARQIVRTGPYRWVRHPLYLAEAIATFGSVLQFLSIASIAIFAVQLAFQCVRILYEEQVLADTLPDYTGYSAEKWRLVPHLF